MCCSPNETRKLDVAKLKAEHREAVLTKSKYRFLKNPENLTEKQALKLSELVLICPGFFGRFCQSPSAPDSLIGFFRHPRTKMS